MAEYTEDALAGMSDEEYSQLDLSTITFAEEGSESSQEDETDPIDESQAEDLETSLESSEESEEDDEHDESEHSEDEDDAESDDEESEPEDEEETTTTDEESVGDFESQVKELLAPFKANGKMISVADVNEARTLMQMGANYSKKMAGLKPNLKMLKMLENNGLLEESKLSYLIDLDKKNPEAITKLIKDAGIDPLDVDVSTDTEYQPNTYTVGDKEVELGEVLKEIEGTSSYNQTIDIVSNKWDDSSKRVISEHPELIEVLNSHVADGTYDNINTEVERRQMLGQLSGLSDIEAYKTVGDSLYPQVEQTQSNQGTVRVRTESKPKQDPKLRNRKRAASTTKTAPGKKQDPVYNPLNMDDSEFEKLMASKFN